MPTKYWRSPETFDQLNRLERPGFAAEFLRRNAGYRRDYTRTFRKASPEAADSPHGRRLARRWGLRFRP